MTKEPPSAAPSKASLGLCLGALGVVFGDIGTSPLYTMKECLAHLGPEVKADTVLGVLSLIFWALLFSVSFKYLTFVTKADNRKEGGIFALLALAQKGRPRSLKQGLGGATVLILLGAALLYGDGIITPAISVLGAAEGLKDFNPALASYTVPVAVVILAGLFAVQHKGTRAMGSVFGPVILGWFVLLGILGLWSLLQEPAVLRAINPAHGYFLLVNNPDQAIYIVGSIVLAITGAEALYADMGHFGRTAIARAWYFVVLPGLLLNYFGQGAHALAHPDDTTNPFFALVPDGAPRLILIGTSMVAAIVASQALITGTFSLTRQAIQLGFFPRLKIVHTNAEEEGQIYVPLMNAFLAISSIAVVISFGSVANLVNAYGIAVTGTMVITTYAFYRVTRLHWHWPWWIAFGLCGSFMIFDLALFGANAHKFFSGGWLPVVIAAVILAVMHTWKTGRNEIQDKVYGDATNELELSSIAKSKSIVRVSGGAVFMVATPKGTPLALLHHLKANKCLQKTVVLLTISFEEIPEVEAADRLTVEELGEGVWRAIGRFGYMETPDVGKIIEDVRARGVPIVPETTTYYFNREMIITGGSARMWEWQKRLYAFLSRNATPVKDYYQIMPTQIIEIGLPVQL